MNCLTTKYLVQITSSEKFSNANGILISMRGIGCLIGPYFAGIKKGFRIFLYFISKLRLFCLLGFLSEKSHPKYTFIFAGSSFIISFAFSLLCIIAHKYQSSSAKKAADNERI